MWKLNVISWQQCQRMVVLVKCDTGLLADKARGGNCQHYLLPSMHSRVCWGWGGGTHPPQSHAPGEMKRVSLALLLSLILSIYLSESVCVRRQRQSNWKINRIRQRIFSIMFIFSWTHGKKCKFSISIIFASTLVKSHKKYIYKKNECDNSLSLDCIGWHQLE